MRNFTLFILLALYWLTGSAQDISITFSGTSPAVKIDSVTATNLATDESIILPGDATLLLTPKTGMATLPSDPGFSLVYPNPFPGQATILARVTEPQDIGLIVRDLSGRTVTRTRAFVQPGDNSFSLTLSAPGIYLAIFETATGSVAHKLICTSSSGSSNRLQPAASPAIRQTDNRQLTTGNRQPTTGNRQPITHNRQLKSILTTFTLGYSSGDEIQYHCFSGTFSTIFSDSPVESKNYEVAFPPIAVFTIDPGDGSTETRFTLDASGCIDAETPTDDLEVRWDFDGDSIWDTEFDLTKSMVCQFPSVGPYSIRLEVRDQDGMSDSVTTLVTVTYPSFTDSRDGNVYHYKKYRNQYWMLQNLAYLPAVSPSGEGSQTEKHYYVYGHESVSVSEAKATDNYNAYGVLYNWPASLDACPSGWHLPGDDEWMDFEMYLGMDQSDANYMNGYTPGHPDRNSGSVGWQLKEAGTAHWNSPNTRANNSSNFTALPAGVRMLNGGFGGIRLGAYFWSSTTYPITNEDGTITTEDGIYRSLEAETEGVVRLPAYYRYGFSIRCIKD